MGERGRPRALLTVSDEERVVLERWSRRPKSPHSIAQRARIVLLASEGLSNVVVAERVGVNQATVVKWRKRFLERRLDGLVDEPRPGAPRTISDDDVERVVVKTLEDKPVGATHWSTRDLARQVGMSPSSVARIWRAFGLKPWAADTFKLSEDPQFLDKVRDVVGLYLNPPEKAVVLCVDEKTGIQALDRTQPILPMRPHAGLLGQDQIGSQPLHLGHSSIGVTASIHAKGAIGPEAARSRGAEVMGLGGI